ncbi:hypothetical protein NBRC116494_17150 [Aurantivibrio plasticivorans]
MKTFRSLVGVALVTVAFGATAVTETTGVQQLFDAGAGSNIQLAYFDVKQSGGHFHYERVSSGSSSAAKQDQQASTCSLYQHAPKRLSIYKKRYCEINTAES